MRRLPLLQPSLPLAVPDDRQCRRLVGNARDSAWCRSGDAIPEPPNGAEAEGTMRRRPYRSSREEPIVSDHQATNETPDVEVEVEVEVEATVPAVDITFGDPRSVVLDDDWNDD